MGVRFEMLKAVDFSTLRVAFVYPSTAKEKTDVLPSVYFFIIREAFKVVKKTGPAM